MDDIDTLELTPSLLKFYRSRIHDLQREQNASILNQLKHVEMSAQERKALERELLEYRDELHETQQDLDDTHNALVRERRAVIELVEEHAQLHGTYPHTINNVF
jgi:chromosome segregation ATPase